MAWQKRDIAKSKRKILQRKSCWVLFRKQRSSKEKLKGSIEKPVKKKKKDKIKEYQRKRYQQLIQYKKEALENK